MSKIAITSGDPAGVGPEIIEKWVKENHSLLESVCLIGPSTWLKRITEIYPVATQSVGSKSFRIKAGQPCLTGAKIAMDAMETAAFGCVEKHFSAGVTGPVSKIWMKRVGFNFPGQTEFFANCWGGTPVMAFAGGKMLVVLVTWHIPLTSVAEHVSKDNISNAVNSANQLAIAHGAKQPRIGVCGLNPHAGEEGILGKEEGLIINPILKNLVKKYPGLSLCQPADTLFWRHLQGEFDIVVALYHDQGLGPLKTIDFDSAVNITLGLPWIRTSPDHGTAFHIAGKGLARHKSLNKAIILAKKLSASTLSP